MNRQSDRIQGTVYPSLTTPYDKIPNARLGVWEGNLGTIHIVFPAFLAGIALESQRPTRLSEDMVRTLYEKGLRPCIAQILPEAAHDWPPAYATELSSACADHGTPGCHFRSLIIPPQLLSAFVLNLRQQLELNGVDWAEDFILFHTVRGMRHATRHRQSQDAVGQAALALEEALKIAHIPLHATESGDWWINVGLEFSSDMGECLQWSTPYHYRIIENVLGISSSTAIDITTLGHPRYSRDIVSHLPEVSGCRVKTGHQRGGPSLACSLGPFEAVYLQLYTDEISSKQCSQRGRPLGIRQAMGFNHPVAFMIDLLTAFHGRTAATSATTQVLPQSIARIELRVPLEHVGHVLVDIDEPAFRECLLSFPSQQWK